MKNLLSYIKTPISNIHVLLSFKLCLTIRFSFKNVVRQPNFEIDLNFAEDKALKGCLVVQLQAEIDKTVASMMQLQTQLDLIPRR